MPPEQPRQFFKRSVAYVNKHRVSLVVLVCFALVAAAYGFGYRIGPGFHINRVGILTLTNLPAGTEVYTDQVLRTSTKSAGDVHFDLASGGHTIIVAAPNDYPWSDALSMRSGVNVRIDPILVGTNPTATALLGDEKAVALAAVASTTLPTSAHPLRLEGGCAAVYVENNRVLADAVSAPGCTPPSFLLTGTSSASTIVFAPVASMVAVLAFPGRQDALVIQLNHTLYALAVDPRSPQFFAPILTGTNPIAGALRDGTIVVRNNNVAYKLKL